MSDAVGCHPPMNLQARTRVPSQVARAGPVPGGQSPLVCRVFGSRRMDFGGIVIVRPDRVWTGRGPAGRGLKAPHAKFVPSAVGPPERYFPGRSARTTMGHAAQATYS